MNTTKVTGNAIVGQSGGPTAAINATLAGVIRGVRDCAEIKTLYGAVNGIEGILNRQIVDLTAQVTTEEAISDLAATPAAGLGSCRKKLPSEADDISVYEKLFSIFEQYDIRYFFYIGGNDSMDTVYKLSAYAEKIQWDIRIMGIPKTIDNDLLGTDHTPGFGSAAKFIAVSMQEILRDCAVYTVPAVTIVEVMGRDAGWLTAASAIPRKYTGVSPDFVYLPERVFSYETFFADVANALAHHPNVVIAVSEGIRLADGHYVGEGRQSGAQDVFGHRYLSGTGKTLELAVKEKFGCKVRSVELNILQRCASHLASKTDIEESLAIGAAAVRAALNGETGKMMCFVRDRESPYHVSITSVAISSVANLVRTVPDAFFSPFGNNVNDACIAYLLPLCEGEADIRYVHGLPAHFVIDKTPVVLSETDSKERK